MQSPSAAGSPGPSGGTSTPGGPKLKPGSLPVATRISNANATYVSERCQRDQRTVTPHPFRKRTLQRKYCALLTAACCMCATCSQQLGAELGRGGFGAVFQALNVDTG